MSRPLQRLQRFFRELKRRNVYKVAVGYLVAAFVALQAADLLVPETTLPSGTETVVVYLAIVGFPIALVIAWAFEMTRDGVRRTPEAEPVTGGEPGEEAAETAAAAGETRTAYRVLIGLGLVAAAVAGGWYLTGSGGRSVSVREGTVAVLPFEVTGTGAEDWQGAMVSLLTPNLDGAGGITTIADRTVFAALEEVASVGRGTGTEEALEVARDVGAEYAVVGSATQLGGELQLAARLHESQSGHRLDQVTVRGPADSITALTDSLTRRMLAVMLEESEEEIPSVNLARMTTQDPQALKAFLNGQIHYRAAEFDSATADFRAAVEEDSTFALAYARLGLASAWTRITGEREPERYLDRALELSEQLPPRERRIVAATRLRLTDRPAAAADTLRRLTEAYPDDPLVWYSLGETIYHGPLPGGPPEAENAFERAAELDPGSTPYHVHLLDLSLWFRHDSALAARRIAEHPGGAGPVHRLGLRLTFGSPETREAALAALDTIPLGVPPSYVVRKLDYPTDAAMANRVLLRLRERNDVSDDAAWWWRIHNVVKQGHLNEAVDLLPREADPQSRSYRLAAWRTLDLPVPDSLLRRLSPDGLSSDAPLVRLWSSALYLLAEDRLQAADELLSRIRAAVDTLSGPRADFLRRLTRELRGYRAWTAGERERAAELWSEPVEVIGYFGSLWRGDLHRELGRLERAEGWYLTAWQDPLAHRRLGRLYEEMGRPEEAAAAYRRFIAAWEDADESLQPWVQEAGERLQALNPEKGEAGR